MRINLPQSVKKLVRAEYPSRLASRAEAEVYPPQSKQSDINGIRHPRSKVKAVAIPYYAIRSEFVGTKPSVY